MSSRLKHIFLVTAALSMLGSCWAVLVAQDIVSSSDVFGGGSVFVFREPRKFFRKPAATFKTDGRGASLRSPVTRLRPEEIAPEDWINEVADNAIEERKLSDSEPFLSLPKGFLNSRAYFCESPQFPVALKKAKKKTADLKVLVTVGAYGGILQATVQEGDASFRSDVYKTLGSMNFRQSYFMGKPVRIEGVLSFSQNRQNSIVCRDASQELTVPDFIDGGVLNDRVQGGFVPELALDAASSSADAKIQIVVDEKGQVIKAQALGPDGKFTKAAVDAALKATFPRSSIAGKPVKVQGILEYRLRTKSARPVPQRPEAVSIFIS